MGEDIHKGLTRRLEVYKINVFVLLREVFHVFAQYR